MDTKQVVQVIGGMAIVTYLPRLMPMWILSGRKLPLLIERWLWYVPPAILGTLLCASLSAKTGELSIWGFDVRSVIAAVPAGYIAARYRNILLTVAVGIIAAGLARLLLPAVI